MTILQAIVLGLVQGLTEFIPVSSTGHLEIIPILLGWGDPGAAASAVIQFGTWFAAVAYFWRDIARIAVGFFRGLARRQLLTDPDSRDAWLVIIGTIPIVIVGLALKDQIETVFRGLWVVTAMVIGVAILMWWAESICRRSTLKSFEQLSVGDAIAIGLGQCLALVPGASRSGSTIMAALFRGIDRASAARYSFLLSIPAIGAAGLLQLIGEREHLAALGWTSIAVAVVVAFVSGWASIWFLLRFLRTHTTMVFIYYRLALGAVMIVLLATGLIR